MERFSNKKTFGNWGEKIAADFLKIKGYSIVMNNYRCLFGEIDLICRDGEIWCFVEVKTRHTSAFGPGYLAVTRLKQKHMIQAAQYYLNETGMFEALARFDIVSIDYYSKKDYQIELLKNAF